MSQLTLKRDHRDGALIVNVGIDGRRGPIWSAAWSEQLGLQLGLSRKPRWQRSEWETTSRQLIGRPINIATDRIFANNCLIEVGSRQVVWAGCCSPTMNDFNQILPTSKEAASCRLYSSQPRGLPGSSVRSGGVVLGCTLGGGEMP